MLLSHLHQWTIVITGLKVAAFSMENALARAPEAVVEREYSEIFNSTARNTLDLVAELCSEVELMGARDEALRLRADLEQNMKVRRLASALDHLFQRVQADTKAVALIHVPPPDRDLYELGSDYFKAGARRRFKGAVPEMTEAVKCFALGRHTASVFHSMRAAEAGVRTLGKKMAISVPQPPGNWADIVNKASAKIKDLPVATAAEARRRSALASACSHAHMLRLAYRNEVMHPNARYSQEQARQVLEGTKGFLEDLAKGL